MRIYLGLKSDLIREIFKAKHTPTEASHGHLYNAVIGPFVTLRGAKFMRDHGQGNLHIQCVYDAERIAKLYT